MRKLRSKKAETLVETLVSILVVVLVMLFLSTAITTASRVNSKVRKTDISLTYSDAQKVGEKVLTVKRNDSLTGAAAITVDEYEDANGYTYYKESEQ